MPTKGERRAHFLCEFYAQLVRRGSCLAAPRHVVQEPGHQSRGFGGLLLDIAEEAIVKDSGVKLFWCNARAGAIRFYERHGWNTDSEQFDIPTVGPHRKMVKRL